MAAILIFAALPIPAVAVPVPLALAEATEVGDLSDYQQRGNMRSAVQMDHYDYVYRYNTSVCWGRDPRYICTNTQVLLPISTPQN